MRKLGDNTEVGLCLKSIQHQDDVLMPQIPQDFNLLPQVSDVLFAFAMFHNELHGSNLPSKLSAPLVDLHRTMQSMQALSVMFTVNFVSHARQRRERDVHID